MADNVIQVRWWTVAVLAVLLATLLAGPALAHARLLDTVPADGAEPDDPPTEVVLRFTEPIGEEAARVEVTAPDGSAVEDGAVSVAGVSVTQELQPLEVGGEYRVAYSVVSDDGHRIEGLVTFTVAEEVLGEAAGATEEPVAEDPQEEATEEAVTEAEVTAAPAPPDVTGAEPAATELPARSWGPWLYVLLAVAGAAGLGAGLVGRSRAGRAQAPDGRMPDDPPRKEPR